MRRHSLTLEDKPVSQFFDELNRRAILEMIHEKPREPAPPFRLPPDWGTSCVGRMITIVRNSRGEIIQQY